MTAQNYHLSKEGQQKELNSLIQTVKQSSMDDASANTFIELASAAINSLHTQRAIVYKELEDCEIHISYFHDDQHNHNCKILAGKYGEMCNRAQNIISTIAAEIEETNLNLISGPTGNKLSGDLTEMREINHVIAQSVDALRQVIIGSTDTLAEAVAEEKKKEQENSGEISLEVSSPDPQSPVKDLEDEEEEEKKEKKSSSKNHGKKR